MPCGNSLNPLENKAKREILIRRLTLGRGIGVWGKGGGNRPLSPGEGSREGLALPLGWGWLRGRALPCPFMCEFERGVPISVATAAG